MKSLREQFIEFRTHTPKYAQWLLLIATILIVGILLLLMVGKKTNSKNLIESANPQVLFKFEPELVQFKDTVINTTARETVTVSVNTPIIIDSVKSTVTDITVTSNCDNLTDSCLIDVVYKPTLVQPSSDTTIIITWHIDGQSDNIAPEEIPVKYNSVSTPIETPSEKTTEEKNIETEQPVETELAIESESQPVEIETPVETEPVVEGPKEEPAEEQIMFDPFAESSDETQTQSEEDFSMFLPEPEQPKPVQKPVATRSSTSETKKDDFQLPAEKCSDFAIAAYDTSGTPIGWIKPEHGAHFFHPFSDKDCSNPTGTYNTSTGVITSLTDGSKIGTDADHIGYRNVRERNLSLPKLSSPMNSATMTSNGDFDNAIWSDPSRKMKILSSTMKEYSEGIEWMPNYGEAEKFLGSGYAGNEAVISSEPFDRTFILRQFKPIPATIVSEVRADPSVYGCKKGNCDEKENYSIPVRATVDRNVFSDDGRTIIIPTGTLLMGYLDGELPGPYQAVGRMNIKWYQFIRPDGVEFNFDDGQDPYSADAQGRMGVPGHGSTDYMEQMVMPILTSLVPAAVNMIAPIADTVVNQINLDNNTIVQSGTIRSSEMAKQEVISTWNKIAQKLMVDAIDNTTPPFSIAAGTRINVFSPVDLIVTCQSPENEGKKCAFVAAGSKTRRQWSDLKKNVSINTNDPSWIGQVRSFDMQNYCTTDSKGKITIGSNWAESGADYRTVLMFCESQNYEAKNNVKQAVYNESVQKKAEDKYGTATYDKSTGTFTQSGSEDQIKAFNQDILGLSYDENDYIIDPWASPAQEEVLHCDDGSNPDPNGCCTGETYTDMGDDYVDSSGSHFACCPDDPDADCLPPIPM